MRAVRDGGRTACKGGAAAGPKCPKGTRPEAMAYMARRAALRPRDLGAKGSGPAGERVPPEGRRQRLAARTRREIGLRKICGADAKPRVGGLDPQPLGRACGRRAHAPERSCRQGTLAGGTATRPGRR